MRSVPRKDYDLPPMQITSPMLSVNVAKTRSTPLLLLSENREAYSRGSHEAEGFLFCEVNNEDRIESHR